MSTSTTWWAQPPVTPFATPTGITLSTGAQDIEKGNIYGVPAGSPVSVPVSSTVKWEDSQHVVLQDAAGNVLNFLHVTPSAEVGQRIEPNHPFGTVSTLGSAGQPHSMTDPVSHISYVESGNIVEFGVYDSVKRAVSRENFSGGRDQPADFTGIFSPDDLVAAWKRGDYGAVAGSSTALWLYAGVAVLLLILVLGR